MAILSQIPQSSAPPASIVEPPVQPVVVSTVVYSTTTPAVIVENPKKFDFNQLIPSGNVKK
jgi:hypothetical protein